MRRLLILVLALLAVAEAADAQFRVGRRRPGGASATQPATIAMKTPTTSTTLSTTESGLSVCVEAFATAGIGSVTWVSDQGPSGVATETITPREYCVTIVPSLTVAQDTVALVADTALTGYTPNVAGTAWTCPVDTSSGANPVLAYAAGAIGPTSSNISGSARSICLIAPSPAITGTDYTHTMVLPATTGGATDGLALVFGYVDANNYCTLTTFGASATDDLVLTKMVAGVPTVIQSANVNPLPGDVITIEVNGSSLIGKRQGTAAITTSDGACDNGVGVGLGWGAFRGQTGTTTYVYDTFTEASDTILSSHTADTGGANWAADINTCVAFPEVQSSSDTLAGDNNANLSNCATTYTFTPSTPLPSADYTVSLTVSATTGTTNANCFGGRYDTATDDYVALCYYAAGANPDVKLVERVSGVVTVLDSADCAVTAGHVYFITFSGTAVSAGRANTVCLLDGTTSVLATGKPFLGWGSVTGAAGDDLNINMRVDNFLVTAGSGGDTISLDSQVDSVTVVDRDASTPGVALSAGANAITFTATPLTGTPASVVFTVTREVADTTPPSISISSPTSNSVYPTAGTAVNIGGIASDNSGTVTVTWECTTSVCTPDSGTATLVGSVWTVNNIGIVAGPNDIVVTATDGAGVPNTATDTITVNSQSADVTPPTIISFTRAGSASDFLTATALQTFAWSASDAGSGIPANGVTWACVTCSPSAGTASGTTGGTFNVNLANGPNTVTVTVADSAGYSASDSIIGTLAIPLSLNTTTLPPAVQGSAYGPVCLGSTGGTAPYTYTLSSGTLPTGVTLSAAGCFNATAVTGTTASGLIPQVTDAAMATDLGAALTLTVSIPGSEGPQDYYHTLAALPTCVTLPAGPCRHVRAAFRDDPVTGEVGATQVAAACSGSGCGPGKLTLYTYATDTDPQKQDGVKMIIPQFRFQSPYVLGTAMDTAAPGTLDRLSLNSLPNPFSDSNWANGRALRVSNGEVMLISVDPFTRTITSSTPGNTAGCLPGGNPALTCLTFTAPHQFVAGDTIDITGAHGGEVPSFGSNTFVVTPMEGQPTRVTIPHTLTTGGSGGEAVFRPTSASTPVVRGSYGTTPTAHSVKSSVALSLNSIGADAQIRLNALMQDGYSYLVTWDQYLTNSHHGTGSTYYKWVNLRKTTSQQGYAPAWESKLHYFTTPTTASSVVSKKGCSVAGGWIDGVSVGSWYWTRSYSPDAQYLEPHGTDTTSAQNLCANVGRWTRHWVLWQRIAGDLDHVYEWVSDEGYDPVLKYDDIRNNQTLSHFNLELDVSSSFVQRNDFRDLVTYFRNVVYVRWQGGTEGTAADVYANYIAGRRPK